MIHNSTTFEQNPKLGFYKVGDHIFYSKPEAYLFSVKAGLEPSWYFNNVEYAKCDWQTEPETNLRDLYRLRAQQLRDKYDWIRIEASGGGDSTTAIFSFLLNNIHLDEVVFRYPKQIEKNVTGNPRDYSPDNTLSEWDFAAKPLLHWIQTNYPQVQVTFHDYSDKILDSDYLADESWIFTTQDWFQPGHGAKHDNFDNPQHWAQADSGKKIGIVYGIDKPKVVLINNKWYIYFVDVFANHPNPVTNGYTNLTTELFYWTPDLPELVIKQAHMVKTWFDMKENSHLKYLLQYPISDPNLRTTYERIIKAIIYPDYDQHTWQTAKPTSSFYNEMDHWFYTNLNNTKQYQVWQAGLKYLTDNLDKNKFMTNAAGEVTGLRWNKSTFYYLGPSSTESTGLPFVNQDYRNLRTEEITVLQDRKLKRLTV